MSLSVFDPEKTIFRIRIYDMDTITKAPSSDLCDEVIEVKTRSKFINLNLEKYKINIHNKDFFVAVLSKNLPARSTIEKDLSSKLVAEKVKATQSLSVFSHSEKIDTEEERKAAVEKIQSLGHDAIITIVLVKKTEDTRYVPGTTSSIYSTPGYYEMDKIYFVESNVYDAKTAKLVWSAQSETFNPSTLESTSKDFAVVMVEALKKAGLINKEEKPKK